jgi:hypothetical protein
MRPIYLAQLLSGISGGGAFSYERRRPGVTGSLAYERCTGEGDPRKAGWPPALCLAPFAPAPPFSQ